MPKSKKEKTTYVVCLFKFEGMKTYRAMLEGSVEACEKYLKNQIGNNKVTAKKFFEIDCTAGTFEEF